LQDDAVNNTTTATHKIDRIFFIGIIYLSFNVQNRH
jgi:hypothetical protein